MNSRKGIGKGVSGFVVKPMGSLFDGISMSLDGLKRFAQSEPVTSMRLPRHLIKDVPIIPFSEYLAEGYEILRDLQNDNIAVQEAYWAHFFFTNKKTEILYFITDAKIYQLHKTHTQILKKWRLVDRAISLNKIEKIEVVKVKPDISDLAANSKPKPKKKTPVLPGALQEQVDNYDLFVSISTDSIFFTGIFL